MRKFFAKLRIQDSWNYRKNRGVLLINLLLAGSALFALLASFDKGSRREPARLPTEEQVSDSNSESSLVEKFEGRVERNMTFSDVLSAHEFPTELIGQLVAVARPIYNLRRLVVGNRFELERAPDGTLQQFSYEVDSEQYLTIRLTDEGYEAEMTPVQFETREEYLSGVIQRSLLHSLSELENGEQLALSLAEIFAYDLDFNTELQPNDHFKVAVEKQYLDGEFVRYGKILAAEFFNDGRVFTAFHFDAPSVEPGYYDASANSLRKDLLRSPIKFSRISSTFSTKRFHPILHSFRAHPAIDYAAPVGTPVIAAGNGKVEFAGWKGGFGKFIQIRHANGYCSMYGHLSRLGTGIRSGAAVHQGQVIGFVGATGLATGPHLDYRVTRNGVFINPLSLKAKPAQPLPESYRPRFEAMKRRWQSKFASLTFPSLTQVASAR
ncbi:MAG: peptidoglycan DD-metalloendopeptidase family protein [Acidobacteriota bacterium]